MARKYQLHGAFPSKAGDSAYEVAQKNGFEGTEQEWLTSLIGPRGPQGSGDSAYQIAKKNGFEGTEQEWLDSLVGPQGDPGPEGPTGATFKISQILEEDVSSVSLSLPANWENILIFNVHVTTDFTADMSWSLSVGSSTNNQGTLAAGLKGLNIYGIRYLWETGQYNYTKFIIGITNANNTSDMAMPSIGNKKTSPGSGTNTMTLKSLTEGATFPKGTRFDVWGVYV